MIREIEVDSESMAEQKLGGYSSRYRFTGKELDPLSGLYDFGARYYDPRLSVWFGVDPPRADKYAGWSPFTYTANNPIKFIDPDGRDYYEGENGKILWFNSTEKSYTFDKKTYKNIGESYASFDGNYLKYHYQNKDKDGNLSPNMQSFAAVSGRPDANSNFDYSKQNQMNPSNGPIPEGSYTMNMNEAPDMTTYESLKGTIGGFLGKIGLGKRGLFPGGRGVWGDGRIDINPDNVFVSPSNNPFELGVNRGGFTIHGGSTPGSAGCIDLCSGFGGFKSLVEQNKGNTNEIILKVKYNMVRPVPSRF